MSFFVYRKGLNLVKRFRRFSALAWIILVGITITLLFTYKYNSIQGNRRLIDSKLDSNYAYDPVYMKVGHAETSVSANLMIRNDYKKIIETSRNRFVSYDSVVIVTAVNHAFRTHLTNLRCSLEMIGLSEKLKVVALDNLVADWAEKAGFQVLKDSDINEESHITEDARFGSANFNLLSKRKISAVARELSKGKDVLFTDADMFWCGNALKEIVDQANSMPDANLIMQSAWPRSLLNSGFYFARSNEKTQMLFSELLKHEGSGENDQVIFNRVLCQRKEGGRIVHRPNDSLLHRKLQNPLGCSRNGTLAAVLSRSKYPTGGEIINGRKIFHHSRNDLVEMCKRQEFMILHNNCIFSDKKTARFIVKGFWYVADDEISCVKSPFPMTKEALKRCGKPKCGKIDSINFKESRK